MTTLFVRHKVADYKAWRKLYDSAAVAKVQKENGVTADAVYQSADDPNDITITHEFASAAKAKAFTALPELKQAMQKAGVVGAPTFWIGKKA
jgi:quinol monooxygenase YgiN